MSVSGTARVDDCEERIRSLRAGAGAGVPRAANRLGLDYAAEAERLGEPVAPILDVHTHVNGAGAARVYRCVMDLYGIRKTFSQSQLSGAAAVRAALGDRVEFIAVPEYMAEDRLHAFTDGFLENIRRWHGDFGARCVKLWNAPRWLDFAESAGVPGASLALDSAPRRRAADAAAELGMMFMTHVADPDTWFATKYANADRYGTKAWQYEGLERMLELYPVPWIAAHMAGSPEDLGRLDGLLSRHDNLLLDTSATKWMVRELSKHPREEMAAFFERWRGRILFGSDIVTTDEHLRASGGAGFGADLAEDEAGATELYASRYWALRTMFETGYDGESPIADPDLAMLDPDRHDAMSAPRLAGCALGGEVLAALYAGTAADTVERWYAEHR